MFQRILLKVKGFAVHSLYHYFWQLCISFVHFKGHLGNFKQTFAWLFGDARDLKCCKVDVEIAFLLLNR